MVTQDSDHDRWRGGVDEKLRGVDARLDEHSRRINSFDAEATARDRDQNKEIDNLKVDMATIKTKIAFWAGIGALAGGAIASFIVSLALR